MAIYVGNIKNLNETVIAFKRLSEDKTNSFIVQASRESAELVLQRARMLVPVGDTGDLQRALQIKQVRLRAAKYSRIIINQPVFTVGPRYVTMGGRKGPGVNYGHAVELGHDLANRKRGVRVKARPYLRPAADQSKEQVITIVTAAMNAALEEFGRN